MAFYEFEGRDCPHAPKRKGKRAVCHHLVEMSMKDAVPLDNKIPCPVKGCKGEITRVVSSRFNVIVRGKTEIPWNPGESVRTRVNGQDVRFTFVDHPESDPRNRRRLESVARKAGVSERGLGIGKAYFNEKHGQMCVDVASNVPDPLGIMEKAKRAGHVKTEKIAVNQPYKVRGKGRSK